MTGSRLEEEAIMVEIEEDYGDARIQLANIDGLFIPLVDYWNGTEGQRKTVSYDLIFFSLVTFSNEVGEISELNALFMNDSYHR